MVLHHRLLVAGCALVLALPISQAVAADDENSTANWPQWRGPQRDGVAADKGLLQRWGSGGPKLAWKTDGLGSGYGSLALADGKLFTLGQRGEGDYLVARNAGDGQELWATKVGAGSGSSSTPTVAGELVYAIGAQGDLVCVRAANGETVWRKSLTADFGGTVGSWNYCESPLVDGDKLICTPGSQESTLVALDKRTGELIWACAVPGGAGNGSGYSSTVISEGAGVRQYVQLMGEGTGCVGVDAETGRFLWSYPRVGNGTATIPTPIVRGDYVFCTSGYGIGAALLKLSKDVSGVTAEEVYFLEGDVLQNTHGGLVLVGDYVYGGHGHNNGFPICVELMTGKVAWGGQQRGPGQESAAVTYADGQLYFRYQDGLMALIQASPRGYKLNGKFTIPDVGSASWSHPVIAGGQLFLREQDNLFVYDVRRGR